MNCVEKCHKSHISYRTDKEDPFSVRSVLCKCHPACKDFYIDNKGKTKINEKREKGYSRAEVVRFGNFACFEQY